jgi:PAS domain S-box-containing protein
MILAAAEPWRQIGRSIAAPETAIMLAALLGAAIAAWLSWQSARAARRDAAALARGAERFRRLVNNTPSKLLMTDCAGRCTGINDTLALFTGLPAERMMGDGWALALYPEEAASAPAAWRQAVRAGQTWQAELRLRRHDGAYVWHLVRGTPISDAAGGFAEWMIACTDIQLLVEAREVLARSNSALEAAIAARTAELAQLQKIDALGQLTAGVAHDFNNLLQPILGSLEVLLRRLPPGDKGNLRMVETGLQSTARAATLVQRLLAFARKQDLQPRSIDVGTLLIDLDELIRRTLGDAGELAMDIKPGLPAARVDPNQLELAILNLAINARDAMPGGGLLTISVMARRIPELRAAETFGPLLQPGHYLCISVADTGVGMDEATLARAVEPFFSTKGVGQGTGLGLSMAHGMAAQSGGALRLMSTPGQGTTAEIWLPSSGEAPVPHRYVPTVVPAPAKPATILLVDDEELLRGGTSDLLVELGYVVIEAGSGPEAARYLRDTGLAIDVMVTDYLMPGMNGADLAAEAARLRPSMPVLLVTGYSTVPEGLAARLPRLAKPFRQADMAIEIARLLGRPGPAAPWTPAAVLAGPTEGE